MENPREIADLGLAGSKNKIPFSCAHGKNTHPLASPRKLPSAYTAVELESGLLLLHYFVVVSDGCSEVLTLALCGCGKTEAVHRVSLQLTPVST